MWLLHVLYLFYTDLCVCVLSDCVCSAVILGMPCDFGLSQRKHAATHKLVCVCAAWLSCFQVLPAFKSAVKFKSLLNIPFEPSAGASFPFFLFFFLSVFGCECRQSKPCNNVVALTRAQAGNGGVGIVFFSGSASSTGCVSVSRPRCWREKLPWSLRSSTL